MRIAWNLVARAIRSRLKTREFTGRGPRRQWL